MLAVTTLQGKWEFYSFKKLMHPLGREQRHRARISTQHDSCLHGVSHRISHDQIAAMRAHSITEMALVKLKNSQVIQMITKECYQTCSSSKTLTKQ